MAGIAEDEIVEHTLAQIPECYLFELPPRIRAQGWLAADMTKQMWTGRLRVVQRGMEAAIMLIDRRDGKLFAMSKVQDGAVERVPDSSRYFVLKIQNAQGRHAFVGLAFDDRNQAFDFNVALQEFKKDIERSKMLEKGDVGGGRQGGTEGEDGGHGIPHKTKDLSLKEGQKIRISIGGTGSKTSSRPRKSAGGGSTGGLALAPPPGDTARRKGGGGGGGVGLLAPPPGDTRRARGITKPAPTTVSSGGNSAPQPKVDNHSFIPPAAKEDVDDDPLGLGLGSTAPPPKQQQQPQPALGFSGGLSDMTGLGATLPSSGGMGSATSLPSGQQKNGGYTHDPFSQSQAFSQSGSGSGQGGYPGGVTSTGARGGTTNKAAAADDPFGGLF